MHNDNKKNDRFCRYNRRQKLANQPQPNIDALLQGQIAGVSVSGDKRPTGERAKNQNSRYKYTNRRCRPIMGNRWRSHAEQRS